MILGKFQSLPIPSKSTCHARGSRSTLPQWNPEAGDLHSLRSNYAVLPSGFDDLLVPAMSQEEIMANKIVYLPIAVNRNRIRFRDIWDIAWLDRRGIQTNHEWITGRIGEFGIEDFGERVKAMRQMLQQAETQTRFREEMARFLPLDVITRTIDRPEYMSHVIRDCRRTASRINLQYRYPRKTATVLRRTLTFTVGHLIQVPFEQGHGSF